MNMRQKLFLTFFLIFAIGMATKVGACSPQRIPFDVFANSFTPDGAYYAVEGYYVNKTDFVVTHASDSIIPLGKALPVFEYGPFGDMCQIYAMPVSMDESEIGKDKLRVLILFKAETTPEKLVTPIFQSAGATLQGEVAQLIDPESSGGNSQQVKRSIPKETLYQRLFFGKKIALVWGETIFKPYD